MGGPTIIDHLYAARNFILRNLYEKSGGGRDRIAVAIHPADMPLILREVRADMFSATIMPKGTMKLFAMSIHEDSQIAEGQAQLALNGTHVLSVDLATGVIVPVDHPIPVSERECAALDSFFRNGQLRRIDDLVMTVAKLSPLMALDDEAPVSIPTFTICLDEMAERGLVRIERLNGGPCVLWDASLTWQGRMALNNYRALSSA